MNQQKFKDQFFKLIKPEIENSKFLQKHHLSSLCFSEFKLDHLKKSWTQNFYRNNIIFKELSEIDNSLKADYPIYILKGANTSTRLYRVSSELSINFILRA